MENTIITVKYENPDTHEEYFQHVELREEEAQQVFLQMCDYDGGEIPVDTPLFYLLTAVKYISKLHGFSKTPDFTILPEEDFTLFPANGIGAPKS